MCVSSLDLKIVPQPYCAGEEGVEVGADRGVGNLLAVSCNSADWEEVIERYLDGPGSSFEKCDKFGSGPTLGSKPGSRNPG